MLGRYVLVLLLTIVIEGAVAYLLKLRKGEQLLAFAAINVITNPLLNYLLIVLGYLNVEVSFTLIILLEILVVIAEWQLLVYIFGNPKKRFFTISLLANTTSFLIGVLLFWR